MLQQQGLQLSSVRDDDRLARRLLDGLHQQVLFCRDSQLLGGLLGQYTAIATARCQTTVSPQVDPMSVMSAIQKQMHDTLQAIINNMK